MEIIVIKFGAWVILIRIRSIWHTRLVKIMICRVGNIRKRGRGIIRIIIKIGKIIVISHITQKMSNTNKEKQRNKQINKKKKI